MWSIKVLFQISSDHVANGNNHGENPEARIAAANYQQRKHINQS